MAFRGTQSTPISGELIKRLNDNTRRIRTLEELNRLLENKNDSLEARTLENQEEMRKKFQDIEEKLKDLNIRLMKIENETQKIRKSLEKVVTKPELEELKNFIDLINPIKMEFITRKEVEEMIKKNERSKF